MRKGSHYWTGTVLLALLLQAGGAWAVDVPATPEVPTYRKPNKLDNLIRTVFLVATDVFAANGSSYDTSREPIPAKGIHIQPGAELAEADAGDEAEKKTAAEDSYSGPAYMKNFSKTKEAQTGTSAAVSAPAADDAVELDAKGNPIALKPGALTDYIANKEKGEQGEQGEPVEQVEQVDTINPLYWEKLREEYRQKKALKQQKLAEISGEKPPVKQTWANEFQGPLVQGGVWPNGAAAVKKSGIVEPRRKPKENYRNVRLSGVVSKKHYNKDNQHLPVAAYEEDYNKLFFDAAAIGKLDVIRAMAERLDSTEIRDAEGNTPLLYAIMAGNDRSAKVLIGMDAGVNINNYAGVTPLYAAMKTGHSEIVQLLLKKGADVGAAGANGENVLMLAVQNKNEQLAALMLKKGVDVNATNSDGNTALHFAAAHNDADTAQILLKKNAKVDAQNNRGETPLMLAAQSGASGIAGILVAAGAELAKTDKRGEDAMHMAMVRGNRPVAEILETAHIKETMKVRKETGEYSSSAVPVLDDAGHVVPVPVLRPYLPPEGKIPQPQFTAEEKAEMGLPKEVAKPKAKTPAKVPAKAKAATKVEEKTETKVTETKVEVKEPVVEKPVVAEKKAAPVAPAVPEKPSAPSVVAPSVPATVGPPAPVVPTEKTPEKSEEKAVPAPAKVEAVLPTPKDEVLPAPPKVEDNTLKPGDSLLPPLSDDEPFPFLEKDDVATPDPFADEPLTLPPLPAVPKTP